MLENPVSQTPELKSSRARKESLERKMQIGTLEHTKLQHITGLARAKKFPPYSWFLVTFNLNS